MRPAFGIFLSALLLGGCSQKHTVYVDQSADIVAGKDSVWEGYVVSVKKRAGSFIEGIEGSQPQTSATARSSSQFSGPAFFPIFRLIFALFSPESRLVYWRAKKPAGSAKDLMITRN